MDATLDPRLPKVAFMALKKHVVANVPSDSETKDQVFRASTKFAIVQIAMQHKVDISALLDAHGTVEDAQAELAAKAEAKKKEEEAAAAQKAAEAAAAAEAEAKAKAEAEKKATAAVATSDIAEAEQAAALLQEAMASFRGPRTGCANSTEAAASAEHLGAPPSAVSQLSADSVAADDAHARYHATTILRSLLTHDKKLGGVPIKLLSARQLITFFQSAAGGTRLERRQVLEASQPEAFASAAMIEKVLEEVETGKFSGVQRKNTRGELKPVEIGEFPSVASLSHMCARRSDSRSAASE